MNENGVDQNIIKKGTIKLAYIKLMPVFNNNINKLQRLTSRRSSIVCVLPCFHHK